MGTLSSQPLELRSQLAQTWLPADKDPQVLVHRTTHEQVHRHTLRIPLKDLPRETALFTARIATHQPYICRLLYFHPITETRNYQTDREAREMAVYTDRFLRLREWTREKVALAVHGLRRLVTVHGPMRISEQMVCQNQYGEVKVWISENPAQNHPDHKYHSEEQSMADLAAILTRKNIELANCLLGCSTFKEAAERINRPYKEEGHLGPNHSHRDTAKKKEAPEKTLLSPAYKNVFGDTTEGIRFKGEPALTSKSSMKAPMENPHSAFRQKEEEFNIQATNSITLGRGRDFLHPQKTRTPNKQATPTKSYPKSRISNEGHLEHARGIQSNYRLNKPENTLEFNRKSGTNIKAQEPVKPFVYQPRFQTANNISSNIGYESLKGKPQNIWSPPADQSNLASTVSYHNRRDPRSGHNNFNKDPTKSGGPEAITIINNNVNNYYNNFTHNHILTDGRPSPNSTTPNNLTPTAASHPEAIHQFRTQSKKEEPQSISPHSSNQFFKNTFKGKEKFAMPNFLQQQQKKKPTSQWLEEPPALTNKCRSNINLTKNQTVIASNPQQSPNQTSNYTSLQHIQDNEAGKKYQKTFHFNKNYDPTLSGHKSSTPTFSFNAFGPRTPPPMSPQNFSSFQKGFPNVQFKMPLRTKTTEFYNKPKDGPKKDDLQNKSFTQHELEKSIYEEKQAEEQERKSATTVQHQEPPMPNTPVVEKAASEPVIPAPSSPEPESGKLQFKKQLRNEFKFLLGGGQPKEGKEKQEQSTRTTLNSKADESEPRQVNLKDKIFRKQTAFAQLKKQALKVLTDD